MQTYIILLRGINVSGQKKITMADLRSVLATAGYTDARTYIQSGNLVLKSSKNSNAISQEISELILEKFGFDVNVLALSKGRLEQIILNNPFLKKSNADSSKLHVTLLSEPPAKEKSDALKDFKDANNEFVIDGTTIYLHCPNGYGRIKIHNTFFEKKLKANATTRNWKTLNTLLDMS